MDLEQFRFDVADGIATVTFDRPPVNAQNRRTREELIRVFDTISDRDDIRVAILTSRSASISCTSPATTPGTTGWCANSSTR
jgi:enoyl-CoA hydratase